jgi:hypothetical protein
MDSRTTQPLYGVVFTDTAHGWAVGQDGCILHAMITPPGVAEQRPASQPPYPAYATTIVRGVLFLEGDCPRTGTVPKTVLLDISGRKVLDLKPGPNDASRLAVGVYFVSLDTPAGIETRKLTVTR